MEFLAIATRESLADWLVWNLEEGTRVRSAVGEGRRIWIVPRIQGLAVSRLTVGGVSTLYPSPYSADDWLDALHLRRLDDVLTQAATPALALIIELDGLRRFDLGTEGRPVVERAVREDDERRLAEALVAFEALAEENPVQMLPRRLSEEVVAGHVALAEGVAALTHGRLTSGGEALIKLQAALLEQDLATALHVSTAKP